MTIAPGRAAIHGATPPASFVGDFVVDAFASFYDSPNGVGTSIYSLPTKGTGSNRYSINQGTSPSSSFFQFQFGTMVAESYREYIYWFGKWYE